MVPGHFDIIFYIAANTTQRLIDTARCETLAVFADKKPF